MAAVGSTGPRLRFRTTTLTLLLLLFSAAALYWGWFQWVDRFIYDSTIRIAAPAVDERLVVVGIDERTLTVMGR